MIDNSFRQRYKNIPAAIHFQKDFYETPLHNHEEFEILHILLGHCEVRIGNKTFQCFSGDMVFINPMEVHSLTVDKMQEFSRKCICFDTSLIIDTKIAQALKKEEMYIKKYIPKESQHNKWIADLFEMAFSELSRPSNTVCMDVGAYLSLIISHMIKNGFSDIRKTKTEHFYTDVLEFISKHFSESITSYDASRALHFNQSYFCRRFRLCFGMSFSEYLNIFRINHARRLLDSTHKSICEISFLCGFSEPLYFSKCFKKYIGILPSVYRKKSI